MTHSLLARIVGARRPSVSTALGKLQSRGLVERTDNGHWLLLGEPPGEIDEWPGPGTTNGGTAQEREGSEDA
jgi:predicted transcriptional regulator of viral defense system